MSGSLFGPTSPKGAGGGGGGLVDPMTTRGDIIIRNAANVTDRLGIGTANQVLTTDGTDISWGSVNTPGQTVTVAQSGGDYTTISAAIAAIVDAAVGKPYTILVYPGVYAEDPLTCKAYVRIKGIDFNSVIVTPNDNNNPLFTLVQNSSVRELHIQGPTNDAALYSAAGVGDMYVDNILQTAGQDGVHATGAGTFIKVTKSFFETATGSAILSESSAEIECDIVDIEATTGVNANGGEVFLNSVHFRNNTTAVTANNGGTVHMHSVDIQDVTTGLSTGAVGVNELQGNAVEVHNATNDLVQGAASGVIRISCGSLDETTFSIIDYSNVDLDYYDSTDATTRTTGAMEVGQFQGFPTMEVANAANPVRVMPNTRTFTSTPGAFIWFDSAVTHTHNYANVSFAGISLQGTIQHQQAGFAFNHCLLFNNGLTLKNVNATAANFGPVQTFIAQPTIQADGAAIVLAQNRDFLSQPTFNVINAGTLAVTNWKQVELGGSIAAGVTMTTRTGVLYKNLTTFTGTLTTNIAMDIENLNQGTTRIGIRSAMSTGTFLSHTGAAVSEHEGYLRIGSRLSHRGDTDTYLEYTTDQIDLVAGGITMLRLDEDATDVVTVNPGSVDLDFVVNGDTLASLLHCDAANDRVGIGAAVPDALLEVGGDAHITGKLTVDGLIDPTGLKCAEQAADPGATGAGEGTFWVQNTAPSTPMFTGDTGVDVALMGDPMTTRGDIIIRDAANATARLAVGGANEVLTSDGTDVSWAAVPASPWTATANVIHPTTGTDDVAIGTTSMSGAERLYILDEDEIGAILGAVAEVQKDAAGVKASWIGFTANVEHSGAGDGTLYAGFGTTGTINNTGATIVDFHGFSYAPTLTDGGVTRFTGLLTQPTVALSKVVATYRGVNAEAPSGAGTITTSTGINVLDQGLNSTTTRGVSIAAQTGTDALGIYCDDSIEMTGTLVIGENADHTITPVAGKGLVWVRSDTPNVLIFTDDAGTDHVLMGDPMTTRGDIIIRDATNATARLAVGGAGEVLTSDGTDVAWAAAAGGGLTTYADVATAEAATGSDNDLCYVVTTETIYRYESAGSAYTDDNLHVLSTGDGGNTRWLGVSGRYLANAFLSFDPDPPDASANPHTGMIAIGSGAGAGNDANVRSIMIGRDAGTLMTGGTDNVILGDQAYSLSAIGIDQSVIIGSQAANSAGIGGTNYGNVIVGYQAAGSATLGTADVENVFIGYQAAQNALSSGVTTGNVIVGGRAARALNSGSNTIIGYQAAENIGTGNSNVCVGRLSGVGLGNGDNENVFVGYSAGPASGASDQAVAVGALALNGASPGVSCVAVGYQALYQQLGAGNVGVGYQVMNTAGTSPNNTAVGYQALEALTTDAQGLNAAFGYQAGLLLTTGSGNVLLGPSAGAQLTTEDNQLYIANTNTTTPLIYGTFPNETLVFNCAAPTFRDDSALDILIDNSALIAVGSIATITFRANDDGGNDEDYCVVRGRITDAAAAGPDGALDFRATINGTMTTHFSVVGNYLEAANSDGGMLRAAAGTAALPALTFRTRSNFGQYYIASDTHGENAVGTSSAGVMRTEVSVNGSFADPGHFNQTQTLTSGANVAVDCQDGFNCYLVLGTNVTISAPTNPEDGMILRFEIVQGATAYTVAWNTIFKQYSSYQWTDTLAQNHTATISFIYSSNKTAWLQLTPFMDLTV